jgi:ABC-type branched-subunit amino acid transport system substrate-binding protein
LAALAACVPPPVAAQTVVKIGVVNSFSGFLAGPGDEIQKGIDLYAKDESLSFQCS